MGHVFFWTASEDGSSWYRATQPANALTWMGHQCRVSQRISNLDVEWADAVVMSRPAMPDTVDIIRKIMSQEERPRIVVDLDDDYFHIDPNNEVASLFWTPELLSGLAEALQMVDIVTVPSEGLREALFPKCGHTAVVENGLHAQWLQSERDYSPKMLTIGWAGSANTAAWIPDMVRAVNRVLATYDKTRFLAIGTTLEQLADFGITMVKGRVGAVEYIFENDQYLQACMAFDIWLAPYGDTAFTRAKFATKALESGMLGIPLIASAIRPYEDWLTDGVNGYLVRREHEWSNRLRLLVENPELRRMIGENARGRASLNVLQSLGLDWERVLLG